MVEPRALGVHLTVCWHVDMLGGDVVVCSKHELEAQLLAKQITKPVAIGRFSELCCPGVH